MAVLDICSNLAFIYFNNPPVNAINSSWKKQFPLCLKSALDNSEVTAIVLCGKGKTFSAGADITEFHNKNKNDLFEFIDLIEKSHKPVIAAVHGFALGGGLEISLACHYRISLSNAKFGFPEVKIGLFPAAGGTQRFPRLVGLEAALEWIIYGNEHSASEAFNIGLIDKVYSESMNIQECAKQFAQTISGKSLQSRRLSTKSVPDASKMEMLTKQYQTIMRKKWRGALAPPTCLECTCQSVKLPYEDGMQHEQKALDFLQNAGQISALVYAFFSERTIKKWKAYDSSLTNAMPVNVKSVAVIGLGTMGRGIAISLLRSGFEKVLVLELNEKALQAGVQFIKSVLANDVKKKRINEKQKLAIEGSLVAVNDYNKLQDVDLVIEAVFESMSVKKQVFAKLDKVCKPNAVLASNTSALNIDEIASVTTRPQQVIGMHFFAPAHVMKLLENVRGAASSPQTVATAMKVGEKLNKVTTLVGNCHGFVGNRMFAYYTAESLYILEDGAYPEQIDEVLREYGFAMGRFQVADLSGNDIGYRMRQELGLVNKDQPTNSPERERLGRRYCPLGDLLVESGRLGYKSDGKGWFTYVGRERRLTVDPQVTRMIDDYRLRNKITPRAVDGQEILERMLYPLINEGFKILEEGIAANPSVIDLIFIHGYSWPRHTGGPMYYAHTIGLSRVLRVIERHWSASGSHEPHWKPSRMLKSLVEEHGSPDIYQWMQFVPSSTKSSL